MRCRCAVDTLVYWAAICTHPGIIALQLARHGEDEQQDKCCDSSSTCAQLMAWQGERKFSWSWKKRGQDGALGVLCILRRSWSYRRCQELLNLEAGLMKSGLCAGISIPWIGYKVRIKIVFIQDCLASFLVYDAQKTSRAREDGDFRNQLNHRGANRRDRKYVTRYCWSMVIDYNSRQADIDKDKNRGTSERILWVSPSNFHYCPYNFSVIFTVKPKRYLPARLGLHESCTSRYHS